MIDLHLWKSSSFQKWNSLCFAKCHNLGSAYTAWYYHQISMHIRIGLEQLIFDISFYRFHLCLTINTIDTFILEDTLIAFRWSLTCFRTIQYQLPSILPLFHYWAQFLAYSCIWRFVLCSVISDRFTVNGLWPKNNVYGRHALISTHALIF